MIVPIDGKRRRLKGWQAYKEKGRRDWLITDQSDHRLSLGEACYDAIVSVFDYADEQDSPSLCSGSAQAAFLHDNCTRVSWAKIPAKWQEAFYPWLTIHKEDSP